jgi:CPA1 family monovalent cation:H+ antiporter
VRGAITLAGVLTIPFTIADGSALPARNLAIFLAAGVIVTTLVLASLALPLALRGLDMPVESDQAAEEDRARAAAAAAAIRAVESAQHRLAEGRQDADLYAEAAARIMDVYRRRIDARIGADSSGADVRRLDLIERRLRLAGLQAERAELFRLARARDVEDDLVRRLVREIDLVETRYRV